MLVACAMAYLSIDSANHASLQGKFSLPPGDVRPEDQMRMPRQLLADVFSSLPKFPVHASSVAAYGQVAIKVGYSKSSAQPYLERDAFCFCTYCGTPLHVSIWLA